MMKREKMMKTDKQAIASRLKDAIQFYASTTAEEHVTQSINPEADALWNEIVDLINDLTN